VCGFKCRRNEGFFLCTKEAKNFADLGRAGLTAAGPEQQKFLRRF
jgi:hypothetical protein